MSIYKLSVRLLVILLAILFIGAYLLYKALAIPDKNFSEPAFDPSMSVIIAREKLNPPPYLLQPTDEIPRLSKTSSYQKNKTRSSSHLGLRLAGILLSGKISSAIIEDPARGKQGTYYAGDTIKGFKITKILRDGIILTGKDHELFLELNRGSESSSHDFVNKLDDNFWELSTEKINEKIRNINQYNGQVIISQQFENGEPFGFKVRHLMEGNDIEKMGIENGDIIKKVNGLEMNDISDVLKALYEFSNDTEFQVEVERNNQIEILNYNLDKKANFLMPVIYNLIDISTGQ